MRYALDEGGGGPVTPIDREAKRERPPVRSGPEALRGAFESHFKALLPTYDEKEDGSNNLSQVLAGIAAFKRSGQLERGNELLGRMREESALLGKSANLDAHREKADLDNALDYFDLFVRQAPLQHNVKDLRAQYDVLMNDPWHQRLRPAHAARRWTLLQELQQKDEAGFVDYGHANIAKPDKLWADALEARLGQVLASIAEKRPDLNIPPLAEVVGALSQDRDDARLAEIQKRDAATRNRADSVRHRLRSRSGALKPIEDTSEVAAHEDATAGVHIGQVQNLHLHINGLRSAIRIPAEEVDMKEAVTGLLDGIEDADALTEGFTGTDQEIRRALATLAEYLKSAKGAETEPSRPTALEEAVAEIRRQAQEELAAQREAYETHLSELRGQHDELAAQLASLRDSSFATDAGREAMERELGELREQLTAAERRAEAAELFVKDQAVVSAPPAGEGRERKTRPIPEQIAGLSQQMSTLFEKRRSYSEEEAGMHLSLVVELCRGIALRHSADDELPRERKRIPRPSMIAPNSFELREVVKDREVAAIARGAAAAYFQALLRSTLEAGPRKRGVVYDGIVEADLEEAARALADSAFAEITDAGLYPIDDERSLSVNLQLLLTHAYLPRAAKLLDRQKRAYKDEQPGLAALLDEAKKFQNRLPELPE